MAAVLTSSVSSAGSENANTQFRPWLVALNEVIEQLNNGIKAPAVDLDKILGAEVVKGIASWKQALSAMINADVEIVPDLLDGKIIVHPTGPAPTFKKQSVGTANADADAVPKEKVARPPNSFIIYRQEWHPKVVKKNPGMHNNEISKIIARMWKAETEAVKSEYKRKAEDAKRQHAIDHPGYQYQPRKPFEKKKRMTKNKLAKLKAQSGDVVASDPMKDFDEMLAKAANDKQVTVDTFQAPYRQGFPNLQPSQEVNNLLTFDANDDNEMLLYNQLVSWNADNPRPTSNLCPDPAVLVGQPLADGQRVMDIAQYEPPYHFTELGNIYDIAASDTANNASAMYFNPTAEVERQERISEDVFHELFNFEEFAEPVVEGENAEGVLQNLQDGYELDFE